MKDRLTPKQVMLVAEIEQALDLLRLNPRRILSYKREWRTAHLERMLRLLVIGEIVQQYTLVDECLNVVLARYFFGTRRTFPTMWRARKFINFNYYVLEALSTMEKLRFVKTIHPIPKSISLDIERLNALRNGIAHTFFPENLRSSGATEWKGKPIFTVEGLRFFTDNLGKLVDFFFKNHPAPKTPTHRQGSSATRGESCSEVRRPS